MDPALTQTTSPSRRDLSGRIAVRLTVKGERIVGVEIDSTRPRGVAQVFFGRTPDEVVPMLGLIFSLCSTAQSMAGLGAVEEASKQAVRASQRAARDVLRQSEMLTQTAMRVLMDWPRLLGVERATKTVRLALSTQSGLEMDLFGGANWKVPGGIDATPDVESVHARILKLQDALDVTLYQGGLADKLMAALDQRALNGFGALPDGAPPESGALSRQWDEAGVAVARSRFGAGLRARLMARLADLENVPEQMLRAVEALGPCNAIELPAGIDGVGAAAVETARGVLAHRVELREGKITSYEIDAPTDVNFLNDGVVAQGLIGESVKDLEALSAAAELHVLAIDPCVRCALEIVDA